MIDLHRYRELFESESREHLQRLNRELLRLDTDPSAAGAVEEIFRSLHTLKGMAAAMAFERMAILAHALESLFARVRHDRRPPEPAALELALAGVDALEAGLPDPEGAEFGRSAEAIGARVEALLHRGDREPETPLEISASASAPTESARAESAPARSEASDRRSQSRDQAGGVRVRRQLLDRLLNRAGELVGVGQEIEERLEQVSAGRELSQAVRRAAKLAGQIQQEVLATRMVPVETVFERLPRAVRDVAQRRGKLVNFVMTGREIELDRAILDEIVEPLMHLLRNAVDHGIEPPAEREARGKPALGTVQLAAFREGQSVVVEVSDDGRGLDRQRLREAAHTLGLVDVDQLGRLTDEEVDRLAIVSGLSTAAAVSDTSGRGVGLDAVQAAVVRVGGVLGIRSRQGAGATFSLRLPLTLAIVRSLLVESEGCRYALPLGYIGEVVGGPSRTEAPRESLEVRGERVECRILADALNGATAERPGAGDACTVAVVLDKRIGQADREDDEEDGIRPPGRLAFGVERMLGIRDVVVRRLPPLKDAHLPFNGVTVLGDGSLALLVDLARLAEGVSAGQQGEWKPAQPSAGRQR